MRLLVATSPQWTATVLANLDHFILDHAACERKASATALKLVAHYPDKPELISAMLDLAREELEHFQQVYQVIFSRGLTMGPDVKDEYIGRLGKTVRHQAADVYLLDRLLVGGIIEARGCERFGLVAEALPAGDLKEFYRDITRSEARHHGLFVRLAKNYIAVDVVEQRLAELLAIEAEIVPTLPLKPIVH